MAGMYDVRSIVEEPLLLEPLRQCVLAAAPPSYLRSLKIKVTRRCNLGCVMCKYGGTAGSDDLDTGTLVRVLEDAARLGCRKVHFSGGEVLMRRDFEVLLGSAAQAGMKVTFTSNLTLLTKERAKGIFAHKLGGVSTSLDGASAKVHDAIRGVSGSFKQTLQALDRVSAYRKGDRPHVRINFVMMRENFRDYPAIVRLAGDLGACNVVPMPVDTRQSRLRLSKRLIREYIELIAPRVLEERVSAGMPTDTDLVNPFGRTKEAIALSSVGEYAGGYYREHLCFAPYLHAFVACDGNVYPCCMTNGRVGTLGSVITSSLSSIFMGESFASLRTQMKTERLPSCHGCDMLLNENRLLEGALGTGLSR